MKYNRIAEAIEYVNRHRSDKVTVSSMTQAMKVSRHTVNRWLRNEAQPKLERLHEIAKYLHLKPQDLICAYPEISDKALENMKNVVYSVDPCQFTMHEFAEWVALDLYGNPTTEKVPTELVQLLIQCEQFEKLNFLKQNQLI